MFKKTVLAAVISVVTAPVFADDALKDKDIETMLVSATRFEGPAMPIATNITVIDKEQISKSGVAAVTDVLRSQAGIQLRELGGTGGRNTTVSMRGFSDNAANNTLIIVDGRKLNNPTLAVPALNSIALKDVERIEIVQGSAGVLYGDKAVGGVINVITEKPEAGEIKGYVDLSTGSDGYERYRLSLSQGFDSGLSYRLSAETKEADNYRDNNENSYDNYLAQVRYAFDNGSVYIEGQRINDNLRIPGPITEGAAANDHRSTTEPNNFSDQDTELLRLGGDFEVAEGWTFALDYAWRDEDVKVFWDDYDTGLYPTLANQSTRVVNWAPRLVGTLNEDGSAILTVGYDRTDSEYLVREWSNDAEQTVEALYAQLILPFGDKVTTTLGGRVSKFEEEDHQSNIDHDHRAEAYEAGVTYKLSDSVNLFARYAEAFRFATLDENGFTVGNMKLKPQTSDSVEFGAEFIFEAGDVRFTVFDMDISEEITYDDGISNPTGWNPANTGANVNLPDSKRQGLVVEGSYSLSSSLKLLGNYTYTDAEQVSGSADGYDVPFVAEHTANLSAIYDFSHGISLFGEVVYTGSRYRANDYDNSRSSVSAYTLVNLNLSWSYQDWQTNLRINNLFDKEYAGFSIYSSSKNDDFEYPSPGRTLEASVAYTF